MSGIGFADDLNALAYSKSTQQNCQKLEELHKECLEWASRHGITFALDKYELVHFTRSTRKFDLQASIQLTPEVSKQPTKEVKVLGVLLDSRLTWAAHTRQLQVKAAQ